MKMNRPFRFLIGLLAVVVVLGTGGWLLVRWINRPKPIAPEKLVKVERGNIARSVVAIGRVEPLSKVQVKSKANGIIKALLVDVGAEVVEGQILAELDKENLQAQVREAKATLDAEEANLQVAIASEARARIEAENPELEYARREYERVQKLFAEKIASAQALDDAQMNHELASNRRQLLQAAARSASALVEQVRARVAAARAALDRAEENLSYATIRSPIKGLVLARDTEVGDAVSSILNMGSAATLIMTLGDMSTVYIKGDVDEADVGKVSLEMPVRTTVESFPGESFSGIVTRIAPIGRERDNVTTFEVRVSIANPLGKLRANMTANAEIVLEERANVLLIPEAAIVYQPDGKACVQKFNDTNRAGFAQVAIRTGISNGQRTEVQDGLNEGWQLVLP